MLPKLYAARKTSITRLKIKEIPNYMCGTWNTELAANLFIAQEWTESCPVNGRKLEHPLVPYDGRMCRSRIAIE